MRTQVVIIGGGPAGLLLSQLLHRAGIDTVVLERRSRAHVLGRIRAGVLEWGTVEMLRRAGVGKRMDREGYIHHGIYLSTGNRGFRIPLDKLSGKSVMVYGQTEVTRDLYQARDAMDGVIIDRVTEAKPAGLDTDAPYVTYLREGKSHRINCDFVAGCDGFHGVSRAAIPRDVLKEYERVYPFGWLGVLAETPPVSEELIYAHHDRGFALCSMRNQMLSRYYVQVPAHERIEAWPDARFWDELRARIPGDAAEALITGPSIEKSVAPLRSYVAEPMRWGRLFLCGDAAHIVPPTGAKGLNLAVSDVHYLSKALLTHYQDHDDSGLDGYSATALARVWKAVRFSWWMTSTLHPAPGEPDFDRRIRESELAYLSRSTAAQTALAENYTGLPY